jgi:hypothetical protein
MSSTSSFLLCCSHQGKRRSRDDIILICVRDRASSLCVAYAHSVECITSTISVDICLSIGYLEEEVAVHEPAGVAEANELQDLGELRKNTTQPTEVSERKTPQLSSTSRPVFLCRTHTQTHTDIPAARR